MDSEVTQSKNKSEIKLKQENKSVNSKCKDQIKTVKFRLFPNKNEEEQLKHMFEQSRWYYNSSINVFNDLYSKNIVLSNDFKLKDRTFRDTFKKYEFQEDEVIEDDICYILKSFSYNENRNEYMIPSFFNDKEVHTRLIRGANIKFVQAVNSCISNYKNKNVKSFDLKYRSKKKDNEFIYFEDYNFPSFLRNIRSYHWYRTKSKKRKYMKLKDIEKKKFKSIEIIYDKITKKYFFHGAFKTSFYASDDIRNDNQVNNSNDESKFVVKETDPIKMISLDPGVRKFLVCYDPSGSCFHIGNKANKEIFKLMKHADTTKNKIEKLLIWKRIKYKINEMHWKTISFLTKNYDFILLPEFKTQDMVRKKTLNKNVKRMMLMYSFYSFKQKMKWKCDVLNKKLFIVDESYTSKTCTNCGTVTNLKGKEDLVCEKCFIAIDRDEQGSRNILLKNLHIIKNYLEEEKNERNIVF
jgi:putative transposase